MTKADIERIVSVWQERLGLSHWDIKVRWEMPVSKGDDAEIRVHQDYEQASMRIQQDTDPASTPPTVPFTTWTEKQANLVVVHELLHVFEKETRRPAESLEDVLSSSSYTMFWSWYEHGAENWVDRLAARIVEMGGVA